MLTSDVNGLEWFETSECNTFECSIRVGYEAMEADIRHDCVHGFVGYVRFGRLMEEHLNGSFAIIHRLFLHRLPQFAERKDDVTA